MDFYINYINKELDEIRDYLESTERSTHRNRVLTLNSKILKYHSKVFQITSIFADNIINPASKTNNRNYSKDSILIFLENISKSSKRKHEILRIYRFISSIPDKDGKYSKKLLEDHYLRDRVLDSVRYSKPSLRINRTNILESENNNSLKITKLLINDLDLARSVLNKYYIRVNEDEIFRLALKNSLDIRNNIRKYIKMYKTDILISVYNEFWRHTNGKLEIEILNTLSDDNPGYSNSIRVLKEFLEIFMEGTINKNKKYLKDLLKLWI